MDGTNNAKRDEKAPAGRLEQEKSEKNEHSKRDTVQIGRPRRRRVHDPHARPKR